MIKFYLRLVLLMLICTQPAWAQSVLNPNDAVVTYNSSNPPSQPTWGQIGKWVRTKRVSWNSDSYKCYIYKGMQFRLKFPKNFNAADTSKKYPMIIFFHGIGEKGSIYDNEYQLYHGGQVHMNRVDAGTFDGFLLYAQNISGYWGNTQYDYINELINNFFIQQINLDQFRVMIEGLSGGGMATWDFLFRYPKLVAAATPISAANDTYDDYVQSWKYTPLWQFQGGVDKNPAPVVAQMIETAAKNAGANYKLKIYDGQGHGVWNLAWAETDYFPFMSRAHKANPWALFGRTEFCPGDPVNTTLGLTAGFDGYEWRKDGQTISGANSNTLVVTSFGTYDARVRSGNRWSVWSPIPVVVKTKAPTVTPNIQLLGLQSNVLPTPEGKDSVILTLPDGYASYVWMKTGGTDTLGRAMNFTARQTGSYIARVTENFGCSSSFSTPYPVVPANGANPPDPAGTPLITPVSKTSLKLNWTDKPSPLYNETAFEVYRAANAGGPYTLVGKVNTDVLTFTDAGLAANTRYYYIVRAVNGNGAAPVSGEGSGVTLADAQSPTAPGNLAQSGATRSSVNLTWSASTDDVGIDKYDIYFNGKKTFTVPAGTTSFTAYGLAAKQVYTVVIKARDLAGNQSPASNQVTVATYQNGLNYKFYTTTASWTALPDFNTMTPAKTGVVSTVSVSPRTQNDRFAFIWQGWINIPTSGNYTFETYSDAGSKVYIGSEVYDPAATALVNNDGVHNAQYAQGTINLTRGTYPIIVTYFEVTGSDAMTLYWKNTANGVGNTRQAIPSQYFVDTLNLGNAPPTPSNPSVTVISHNKLRVNWTYNSTLETGFEVYRSTSSNGTYTIVGTVAANSVNYTDSSLNANTTYYYRVRAINNFGTSGNSSTVNGRTQVLPSIPTAPNTLAANAVSGSQINLTWKDNSSNETGFEVWRSANNNTAYVLIATIPANATANASYSDMDLFANARYYYKVRAKNDGGTSGYSNEVNTLTQNSLPVISDIPDRTMRYGTTLSFDVGAEDPDEEEVVLAPVNAPAFVSYGNNGSGGITISLNPTAGDQGNYNIQVSATDQHGGVTTKTFALIVNDNYLPVLNPITNVSVAEKATSTINLSSSDPNASDPTNWTATGLPAFATLTPSGNTAQIALAPGYADAGAYHVTVKVDDGKGGFDTKDFTINVTDVNPNYSVYINFTDGAYQGAAPWYNTNKRPAQNDVFANIPNNSGANSGISMSVLTPWQTVNGGTNTNNQGANGTGVYPANVMTSNWWTQTVAQTVRFTGLNANYKYSFTFFGSRQGVADARVAAYTINGTTVTLNGSNNSTQTVNINNVSPDVDGSITVSIAPAAGSTYAYINALVINAAFDDQSAPAKPGNFAGAALPTTGVKLTWSDQAYNESGYEISRASTQGGAFTILNEGNSNANDTTYTDANATSGQTWYYRARAVNIYGYSPYTDTIGVAIPNRPPAIAAISNVIIKSDATLQVPVTATDAVGDVITLTATGLPSFANLQVNGNGNGAINLAPTGTDIGKYTITVKATDNKGGSSTQSFTVQVTDKKITSVYVNCNLVEPAGAPWNNFNQLPNTNAGVNNLLDEAGAASGINITVLDVFTGANNVGAVTGDNSGVYPDGVMHTFFYDQSNTDKRIRLSGLAADRKYNLVFFGSRESVSDNRNTTYSAGGQSVTLNAASNTSNTVQINGLQADASGNIIFTVRQTAGSVAAYLNALVIQSFVDDGTPLAPANLTANSKSRSSIDLTWADKSNNETGYEVWRSNTKNGTYTLLTTVGANVTSYSNTGLAPNTVYYYKVRGVAGALRSDYSNIATGGTLAYGIYIDFTVTQIQGAPWNATAALPTAGLSWNNLKDDVGNTTSVDLSIVNNFTGTNPAGTQTGNNSGVYPDKVMAESYYTETDTALMLVSGLDQAKQYSFTFTGSRAGGGTRITAYKIGTKVVTLDANDNSQNTVTIENVKPDNNGEIKVYVYTALNYGYISAMVITAYPPDDSTSIPSLPPLGVMQNGRDNGVGLLGGVSDDAASLQNNANLTDGIDVERVFPNPFSNFVNLNMTIGKQQKDARILVRLLDMQGRLIQVKDLGLRGNGVYFERLDFSGVSMQNGIYLLQVLSDGKPVKTIKLIKH